jgi:hypothetical protein
LVYRALDTQIRQAAILGHDVYLYGPAGPAFNDFFNLEQQANIVDQWFGGRQTIYGGAMVESDANPYFQYIRDNIRANTTTNL